MASTGGFSGSNLRVSVDVDVSAGGRSTIHLEDGTVADGPQRQHFVKVDPGLVKVGSWFFNPLTNESHKTLSVSADGVTLAAKDGFVNVQWSDLPDTLLLVVND
jgi:hypothetical protein